MLRSEYGRLIDQGVSAKTAWGMTETPDGHLYGVVAETAKSANKLYRVTLVFYAIVGTDVINTPVAQCFISDFHAGSGQTAVRLTMKIVAGICYAISSGGVNLYALRDIVYTIDNVTDGSMNGDFRIYEVQ